MFTLSQLNHLIAAVDLASKSNLRAKNNSRNPEFTPLYDKINAEFLDIAQILAKAVAAAQTTKK